VAFGIGAHIRMEPKMRSRPVFGLAAAVALFLFCGIGTAEAVDPMLFAVNSGFPLGNAYRCGVSTARVRRAEKIIRAFIGVAAFSPREEAAADARFVESFAAGAYPAAVIPACDVVVAQFNRLERHHRQAGFD
jgi:hypothetical protein